ncbi:hypothetical protein [Alloprevotella tannerae]|jgi:hypothetical protein|uniref:hypothetical protein n=1 Tax=Alloprevotella tannerae TaxID=76122 RepID=UPI001EDC492F|nr:hypothetical protein [Alloprevotella tannerae]MCG2649898.1 hypothetical protein [Alloprevotella tannerae]
MNLRFRLIILSISSLFILGQIKAQDKQQLPHREKYVRVSDFGKLPTGARYLIGVKNEDNKIYFLSSIAYKIGKGGKLTATLTEHLTSDTVFSPAPEICWQIEEKEKKAQWCITSIKEGKYLNYNNKDQTGVYLDSKRVYWDLTLLGEGQIKLSNTVGHSTRYLGFNPIQGENNGYFGNYKTCQSDTLLIFMHDLTLSERKGELQLPADSDRIAFIADTLIDGRLPQSEYLLSDGRVAADGFDTWTYLAASQKAFYLQSASSTYLRHDLSQGEKQLWYYWNGLISTSEDTPRCLVWNKKQGQLTVVDPYEAEVSSFIPIYFAAVADTMREDFQHGIKTLSGGWSAQRLAELDWQDVRALDLRNATLPARPLTFKYLPSKANKPIYISKTGKEVVPETWPFVIADNLLLKDVYLQDKEPIYVPYPFNLDGQTITYEREMIDGNWETLCLPFTVDDWPKSFDVQELVKVTQNGSKLDLGFDKAQKIQANQPVILRGKGKLKLQAREGLVVTQEAEGIFRGNYDSKDINQAYLLSNDGNSFVNAASGSHLSPFRAYILLDKDYKTIDVKYNIITQIRPQQVISRDKILYSIDGIRQLSTKRQGIYIVDGQKIIIK